MNYTDYYITATFITMLFFIKKYHDKYASAASLIKSFIKEIDLLSKKLDNFSSSTQLLEAKLKSLNQANDTYKQKNVELQKNFLTQKEHFDSTLKLTLQKHNTEIKANELKHSKELKAKIESTRKDTLKKSRAVIRGQATEHLAPYIIKNTNPKDYRFLGNPVDYIHFEGLSDLIDGISDEITSIDFIDIKTGRSTLNKSQRRIRDAIKDSRVKFSLINLDERLTNNDQATKRSQIENQKES